MPIYPHSKSSALQLFHSLPALLGTALKFQGVRRKSHSVQGSQGFIYKFQKEEQNLWADDGLEIWVQFLSMENFPCDCRTSSLGKETQTLTDTFPQGSKLKAKTRITTPYVPRGMGKYENWTRRVPTNYGRGVRWAEGEKGLPLNRKTVKTNLKIC